MGCFIGRKVRTFPKDTGFSTYLELAHEPELVELGLRLLRQMGFVGPMKLDFKKHNGRYYLLETNPRFTLWNYLGAVSGMNLPERAAAMLRGERPACGMEYRVGMRWLSLGDDLRGFVREYRPAGQWTWPGYVRSLCCRHVHEVFSWGDPVPGIVSAARFAAANWAKVQRKLVGQRAARPAAT